MSRKSPAGEHGDRAPIGRSLIDALARKDVNVRGETLAMEGAHKTAWITAWLEDAEREMAPIVQTMLGSLANSEAVPLRVRDTIKRAMTPTHQADFLLSVILSLVSAVTQIGAFTAPVAQAEVNHLWSQYPHRPLDPSELAVAVVKGVIEEADGFLQALDSGLSNTAFDVLVRATGDPPGPMDLLAMWRRGLIDDDRLTHGLAQSRLKLEWEPFLKQYAYGPPSAAAAILGDVQNHLDKASALEIVKQNGIDPANYDWLYENAGRPPGVMQMIDAMHRGAFGWDTVDTAIRESDIKDKYVDAYHWLGEHLLPQKTVVAGVHQGVISDGDALTMLLKLGISPTNAGYLIAEGHNEKVATHKQISASQIETAYQDGSLTRDQAQAHLVTLGYLAADAEFILDLIDVQWQQALHSATVTRIKSLYLAHHIDRNTASADLDAAKVSAAHRDLYLQLWDVVRTTPTKTLTEAQAATAYKKQLISESAFRSRLVAMGYPQADVDLLVELNPIPPAAAARR